MKEISDAGTDRPSGIAASVGVRADLHL
ncbi:hypothetical protein RHRU231_590021 [Rhodococcus ruber]|uniref:Uncharacterized protein n=1 Tax=Rhodococcus ruber TaxID=1830 RepID=A0A098BNY6_9NOCA|nr:hypothetical protein RHRU231_590021 [Rhodococcus ruber]